LASGAARFIALEAATGGAEDAFARLDAAHALVEQAGISRELALVAQAAADAQRQDQENRLR
jgi:hypothetical protein